jgi:O-antigen ligase
VAFITTILIVSSGNMLRNLGALIAVSVVILASLRLYEAMAFGRWGAWTGPQFLSQNSYGIQFSTFFPFVLSLPFIFRGRNRIFSVIGLIVTVIAIAGNGSRSSWIAVAVGSVTFLLLYAVTQRKGLITVPLRLIGTIVVVVILAVISPQDILDPVVERFDTFEALDSDKSYQIRQLMIQKGTRLFEDSPIFGVGVGRFRRVSVPLDIPDVLAYRDQGHFDVKSSHNSYVALLGETGLVGIVPFILMQVLIAIRGFSAAIRLVRCGNIWGVAAFSGYIGMSIHLWSLAGLTGTAPWFMYGIVASLPHIISGGSMSEPESSRSQP